LAFIWPFFIFPDLAFFETAYGQIWPFLIFLDLATLEKGSFYLLKYNIILCEVCCDGCHWQLNTGEMLNSEIKGERERDRS